ncbi:MAG: hypothetical protein IJI25_04620 [Eubacterium sp.]|nr:hypothetical protein [Eubacterium sp.]
MKENDTIELLKECNSGIKMAVDSIDEVMDNIKNDQMRDILSHSRAEHEKLGNETHALLTSYHQKDEDPSMIAKSMSWMKTNMKMTMNPGDDTIADLMCAGCDMGVRSLGKYLNRYNDADEKARDMTRQVISLEEKLSKDLRCYL